jgi:hypothetical protein
MENRNSCFIDDSNLKKYSTAYKILCGNLQRVFSDDSSSDKDDADTEKKAKNEGSDISQGQFKGTNSVRRRKKPHFVSIVKLYSLDHDITGPRIDIL